MPRERRPTSLSTVIASGVFRSEAIQSHGKTARVVLDGFAALAMTKIPSRENEIQAQRHTRHSGASRSDEPGI
jgi:hypothetical protein